MLWQWTVGIFWVLFLKANKKGKKLKWKCKSASNAHLFKHTQCFCALQYCGLLSHDPAQQDISVLKASDATVMTSRHPLVPQRVQFSSTQTLLSGWSLINTSCSAVNDATLPRKHPHNSSFYTVHKQIERKRETTNTWTGFYKRSVCSSTDVPSLSWLSLHLKIKNN